MHVFLLGFFLAASASPQNVNGRLQQWKTNWAKRSIALGELKQDGPPKDGIPAIDSLRFVSPEEARAWIAPQELVIALTLKEQARDPDPSRDRQ